MRAYDRDRRRILIKRTRVYSPRTLAVINYADTNGYTKMTQLDYLDDLIRSMETSGIMDKLDLFYIFSSNGSVDFKKINIVDPSKYFATFFNNPLNTVDGVQGQGMAYISTNFNPALLVAGQKYQLNNASRGMGVRFAGTAASNVIDRSSVGGENSFQNNSAGNTFALRINQGSNNLPTSQPVFGAKLLGIVRTSNTQVIVHNKDGNPSVPLTINSTALSNGNQLLLGNGGTSSNVQLGFYFMGAALTNADWLVLRESFNSYLSAIGLTPNM